jgi:Mor family transcriptional regulator
MMLMSANQPAAGTSQGGPAPSGGSAPRAAGERGGHKLAAELLPPLLRDFVRLIGVGPTMALVERFGGLRIYVPTPERATAEHPYAALIGIDNLLKLAHDYGGLPHFQLPKAERALKAIRNAKIVEDYAHKSARQLAAEHRLTESQVGRILATSGVTAAPDRRQGGLF